MNGQLNKRQLKKYRFEVIGQQTGQASKSKLSNMITLGGARGLVSKFWAQETSRADVHNGIPCHRDAPSNENPHYLVWSRVGTDRIEAYDLKEIHHKVSYEIYLCNSPGAMWVTSTEFLNEDYRFILGKISQKQTACFRFTTSEIERIGWMLAGGPMDYIAALDDRLIDLGLLQEYEIFADTRSGDRGTGYVPCYEASALLRRTFHGDRGQINEFYWRNSQYAK
jgi:hypothetical protein